MQLPIDISAVKGTRLQQQLVDQIRAMVSNGILVPGSQLPSTRELANQLNISRRTVVLSYERLMDDGLIVTRPQLGTFICDQLPSECLRISNPEPCPAVGKPSFPRTRPVVGT